MIIILIQKYITSYIKVKIVNDDRKTQNKPMKNYTVLVEKKKRRRRIIKNHFSNGIFRVEGPSPVVFFVPS